MLRYLPAVVLLATIPLHASTLPEDAYTFHIRTTDSRVRHAIDEGIRHSPTFRAIVERLIGSDVIVFLQCDPAAPLRVDGRMTFVSKAGGFRYVVVRLRHQQRRIEFIGLLAHELRHVVEVAETPAIVDSPSLAREYRRLGFVSRHAPGGTSFDTDAAIDAGYQVLADYGRAP